MRVTNNVLINNIKNNLSRNIRAMEVIQNQLTSGRRITRPSEDPTGITESLRISSRLRENAGFKQNVQDALGWASFTDETLGGLNSALQRVYELTVEGANATYEKEERDAIAAEIEQIKSEIESIANTTFGDRYIFGGTNTKVKPYDEGTWQHNSASINYEIGVGVEIPINRTAEEVFVQTDVFGTLDNIITHLENGDVAALSKDIEPIQAALNQVAEVRVRVGATVNRLEFTKNRLDAQEINYATMQSEVDGVDTAWAIMQLKDQENVYRTTLAVGARIIMPTLVDFLR